MKQTSMEGMVNRMTDARTACANITFKTVEAFTAANIPMEKLDNKNMRAFFENEVKNGGAVPKAATLRADWIPKVFQVRQEELKRFLENKMLAFIFDEAEDACQRQVSK